MEQELSICYEQEHEAPEQDEMINAKFVRLAQSAALYDRLGNNVPQPPAGVVKSVIWSSHRHQAEPLIAAPAEHRHGYDEYYGKYHYIR